VLAPVAGLIALAVSGCASTFDVLPEKMGGLPATAPARSAEPLAFPNVYEPRPVRDAKPLSGDEQKKLESDLVTVREQQKQLATSPPPPPPPPAPPPPAAKPPSKTPATAGPAKKPPTKTATAPKKKEPVVPGQSEPTPLKPIN
jgi:hypothetical protein